MARSLAAILVGIYLKKNNPHKSDEEVIKAFEQAKAEPEPEYFIPDSVKITKSIREEKINGMKTFYLNEGSASGKTVIYLHGGAYRSNIDPSHWKLINTLCEATDAEFIVPLYPLLQYSDCLKSFDLITELYSGIKAKEIIIMGDSSGGGLALGLEMYWAEKGLKLPDSTIVMSPWVDIRTCNPEIDKFQKKDPFLYAPTLRVCGRYWSGELDMTDYRVSPTFGNTSVLRNVTMFVGTREIFYADITEFFEKIRGQEGCTLNVGEGMNHVYPLFPIPEAKPAIDIMIKAIGDQR